jgi:hypothetical protein
VELHSAPSLTWPELLQPGLSLGQKKERLSGIDCSGGVPVSAPQVYHAIAAVTAALSKAGIQKKQTNEQEGYQFRGIDDVYHPFPRYWPSTDCAFCRGRWRENASSAAEEGVALS